MVHVCADALFGHFKTSIEKIWGNCSELKPLQSLERIQISKCIDTSCECSFSQAVIQEAEGIAHHVKGKSSAVFDAIHLAFDL